MVQPVARACPVRRGLGRVECPAAVELQQVTLHGDGRGEVGGTGQPGGAAGRPVGGVRRSGGGEADVGGKVGEDQGQLTARLGRPAVLPVQHHDSAGGGAQHVLGVDVPVAGHEEARVRRYHHGVERDQLRQPATEGRRPGGACPAAASVQRPPARFPEGFAEPGLHRLAAGVPHLMEPGGHRADLGRGGRLTARYLSPFVHTHAVGRRRVLCQQHHPAVAGVARPGQRYPGRERRELEFDVPGRVGLVHSEQQFFDRPGPAAGDEPPDQALLAARREDRLAERGTELVRPRDRRRRCRRHRPHASSLPVPAGPRKPSGRRRPRPQRRQPGARTV